MNLLYLFIDVNAIELKLLEIVLFRFIEGGNFCIKIRKSPISKMFFSWQSVVYHRYHLQIKWNFTFLAKSYVHKKTLHKISFKSRYFLIIYFGQCTIWFILFIKHIMSHIWWCIENRIRPFFNMYYYIVTMIHCIEE